MTSINAVQSITILARSKLCSLPEQLLQTTETMGQICWSRSVSKYHRQSLKVGNCTAWNEQKATALLLQQSLLQLTNMLQPQSSAEIQLSTYMMLIVHVNK